MVSAMVVVMVVLCTALLTGIIKVINNQDDPDGYAVIVAVLLAAGIVSQGVALYYQPEVCSSSTAPLAEKP